MNSGRMPLALAQTRSDSQNTPRLHMGQWAKLVRANKQIQTSKCGGAEHVLKGCRLLILESDILDGM